MNSGDWQAGDDHGETSEQENCSGNCKKSASYDEPVLVEDDDQKPDG